MLNFEEKSVICSALLCKPGVCVNWSEQSACAARLALQTGCVANLVASINTIIFSYFFFFSFLASLTFIPEGVDLGSKSDQNCLKWQEL